MMSERRRMPARSGPNDRGPAKANRHPTLDLALEGKLYGPLNAVDQEEPEVSFVARKVEIFSAGCRTCTTTVEQLREHIDPRHEIVVHDMQNDDAAAERSQAFGIRTVPAVVVDGALLSCCKNTGPTLRELHAAGLAKPGRLMLNES